MLVPPYSPLKPSQVKPATSCLVEHWLFRPQREGESCAALSQADAIPAGCLGHPSTQPCPSVPCVRCAAPRQGGPVPRCSARPVPRYRALLYCKAGTLTENRLARRTKNGGTPPHTPPTNFYVHEDASDLAKCCQERECS